MHSVAEARYMGDFQDKVMGPTNPDCHKYTDEEIFHYNFFVWTLAFFLLGL